MRNPNARFFPPPRPGVWSGPVYIHHKPSLYQRGVNTPVVGKQYVDVIGAEQLQEKKGSFWTVVLICLGLTAAIYVPPMLRLAAKR